MNVNGAGACLDAGFGVGNQVFRREGQMRILGRHHDSAG